MTKSKFDMVDMLRRAKENMIVGHNRDDQLIEELIRSAVSYAEEYQHLEEGRYERKKMPKTTEQAVIMLTSHWYESRDGGTAGFFGDNVSASSNIMETVNALLIRNRVWEV